MLLVAGLGNPGLRYAQNRHNIGFMAVDEIFRRHRFSNWQKNSKRKLLMVLLAAKKLCSLSQ